MIHTAEHTVGTTASQILSAQGAQSASRKQVILKGASATIHVGGADVTTANGLPVEAGEWVALELGVGDDLWAVAGAGGVTVRSLITRE